MPALHFLPINAQITLHSIGKYFLILLIGLSLTACGNDQQSQDQTSTTPESTKEPSPEELSPEKSGAIESSSDSISSEDAFTGRVVKGVISNAIINVYPIINNDNTYSVDKSAPPVTTRTNGNGYYQVKTTTKRKDRYYYVEVLTDENSKMLCDFNTGCESSDGGFANFGESFSLTTGFTLSNVVKSKAGKINHAPISPLTHLSIKHAESLPGGISPENIIAGQQFIESTFELGSDALALIPTDLTSVSEIRKLKSQELKLGLISASFMPIIELPLWHKLSMQSIDEIILNANKLAIFLNDGSLSTQSAKTLSVIETDTYKHYNTLTSTPLVILEHPTSISALEGDNVQLDVLASASKSISYQWLKDGLTLDNETSESLFLDSVSASSTGVYSVIVKTSTESIESLSALVSVETSISPVSIVTHPSSVVATEGDSISFKVIAEGDTPLSYQWQKGGSVLINETSSSITLHPITLSDAGTYSALISNNFSSVQSNFADLTVLPAIEPIMITEQPTNVIINEGNAASFSISATGGGFISYQWRKNDQVIPEAYGSVFAINTTTLEDSGSYDVILSNSVGTKLSQPASLNVISNAEPVTIINHPQGLSVNEGEAAYLVVKASGEGLLNYQWLKDGESMAGSNTEQFIIGKTILSDQGSYQVIVSNEESSTLSDTAYVSIIPSPIITNPSTVNLSWNIPTLRADGSELIASDIQGYIIAYGTDSLNLDQEISVNGSNTVSASIELWPNTYYLRIATLDANNVQSDFSNSVQITLE